MPPQTKLPPYLRQLERVLARLETAMLLSELDGFLAGVVICPDMILPSEWLPVALDPEEEGEPVLEHENDIRLILRHYNAVLRDLNRGRYAPLFDIDTLHGEILWELWIEGFERAMALRPDVWDDLLQDADEDVLCALVGLRRLIAMTDAALVDAAGRGDRVLAGKLKNLFDFDDDEIADDDFAYFTNWGTMTWQPTHWDPDDEDPHFARYCSAVTTDFPAWSSTRTARPDIELLLTNAGYGDELDTLAPRVMNWLGFSRDSLLHETIYPCTDVGKSCFSKRGAIDDVSVPQGMLRPWTYQTCVEWGYFVTGSGTPPDRKPLMSRLVTLEYASEWCRDVFNITAPPDLDRVNKHGGHEFSFPRVAFVDGSDDPWRQAGTHRIGLNERRRSTDSEPFILIDGAVHHWDQYGPKPGAKGSWLPPKGVAEAHAEEVRFVKVWLEQWEVEKKGKQDQGGEKEDEGKDEGEEEDKGEEVEEDYNEILFGQDDDNLEL